MEGETMTRYTPPHERTPEQAAAILQAERDVAEAVEAAARPSISNSPEDVQMVIAYISAGAAEPFASFVRKWRVARGLADQRRIDNRAG
jgi:hypothetical protein